MKRRRLNRACRLPVIAAVLLWGCGGGSPPAPPAAPKAPAAATPVPAAPPAQKPVSQAPPPVTAPAPSATTEGPPAAAVEQVYLYNPEGRRDPFRSILVTAEKIQRLETLPPLQRTDVADLKLIGIVWGSVGHHAMVQTPDGKGYTIKRGTLVGVNNGVVKKITERALIVEEQYTDIFGERKMREVKIELRPEKEGEE
jgi:type IV pilus assembly protein PilP